MFYGKIIEINKKSSTYTEFVLRIECEDNKIINKGVILSEESIPFKILSSIGTNGKFTGKFMDNESEVSFKLSRATFEPVLDTTDKLWSILDIEKYSDNEIEKIEGIYEVFNRLTSQYDSVEKIALYQTVTSLDPADFMDILTVVLSAEAEWVKEMING